MSAVAGPSKKTKTKSKSAPAVEDSPSPSDSESSVDSEDLDASPPAPTQATTSKGRKTSGFPRYRPPPGLESVQVSSAFASSAFEHGALSKPGLELWAIRVPSDFSTSRLKSLSVSVSDKSVRGDLHTKGGDYALSVAHDADGVGAEMSGLDLLVPNVSRSGALVRAPMKISRRLILTPTDGKRDGASYQAPAKTPRTQPEHKLKFRNRTYGFDTPGPSATAVTDEAETAERAWSPSRPNAEESPRKKKEDKEKRKKRKSEAVDGTPSKRKKAKD